MAILATSAIPAWLPDEAHAEKEQLPKDPDAAHHSFHLHIGNRLNHAKPNRQSRMDRVGSAWEPSLQSYSKSLILSKAAW